MLIKSLNASHLRNFIDSAAYQNMPNLPISPIRAISHAQNPRAEPNDLLLFIAEEDGEMLGYFGMLPDTIYLNDMPEKVGWMSCLWIDPKTRGRGVAKALIETAYKAYDGRMMVTEFTPEAGTLYQKLAIFQDLTTLKGLRIYDLAKWDNILLSKRPKLKSLTPLISTLSFFTKPIFQLGKTTFTTDKLIFIPLKEIDTETNEFIAKHNQNTLFRRGEKELNWLNNYPWIAEMSEKDEIAKRYHFSSQSAIFRQTWIQVREKQSKTIVACFMLSIREGMLKTPYFYLGNVAYTNTIAEYILAYMYQNKANTLLTFQPALVQYFQQNKAINRYTRPAFRHYLLSKKFTLSQNPLPQIQDGDGDCAFT